MTTILLNGCGGRMGQAVTAAAAARNNKFQITGGIDINYTSGICGFTYPVYNKLSDAKDRYDVIVDFSHHSATEGLISYALSRRIPAVIATTGHNEDELAVMKKASETIPVFYSRNMSLGINLLLELVAKAAAVLSDNFDVEIIERHHNKKLDAPSGTALMLADAVNSALPYDAVYVYDRTKERRERGKTEIGIHSVRGGSVVGEHEVGFYGDNEVITISHSAVSRNVFASGALTAAAFLKGKPAGMYDMRDVVNDI